MARSSVVILVADGIRPDTLASAMNAGEIPALARMSAEGGTHTVTSVFPSVTGPAYTPFIMGRYPGPVGLPGIRWYDRAGSATSLLPRARSYVGSEFRKVDRDIDPLAPTLFELSDSNIGALSVIGRGLKPADREGHTIGFGLRAARVHFSGNVRGWLAIDREIGARVATRIRDERPQVAFCALTGIDKTSHSQGHNAQVVRDALRTVDETAARIRSDAEADGRWDSMHLWIVSDHGHSPVRAHEDLAGLIASWKLGVIAHPWMIGPGRDVAVMVSGNAMAHLYLDLRSRASLRAPWTSLEKKWGWLPERLLERESVDLLFIPLDAGTCEVRARGRGAARVEMKDGRFSYRPLTGDPLAIGAHESLSPDDAYDATAASDYPDALVQIAHLAGSARCGEIMLSASRNWDYRAKYEPIPHVSSHGALHKEHMQVPLVLNRKVSGAPRRTVDVMPSALEALGLRVPAGLDGRSFI
jgi:type I phosphodiesterase/nucleotide pyrophosphatase